MVFGLIRRRSRHPLPKFPASIRPTFENLCEALPVNNVEKYQQELDLEMKKIEEDARTNPLIHLQKAKMIHACSHFLLEKYSELSKEQQALAMGAIRYFLLSNDAISEQSFASGFDDDAKVMNHVLEKLGLEDQIIKFSSAI
ncbi:MAG: hypothetical protein KDD42_03640 [Bdellovibrionales bacterium]|nr:hypothetical protein [Bdellovibrionales bacterium]